ncbi:MAG: glycosyltransferase family 2 protein [Ruminococcus sp.]
MDKVSIIVPVYYVEKYLPECIESLIHQTYNNIEIIFVDDGSTDSSGKICDKYAETDSRIKVIHQQNAGAANAKNTGLNNASGIYIIFMDSDDTVELVWIETLMKLIIENDADMAECSFDKFYKNRTEAIEPYDEVQCEFSAESYLLQYLSR